MSRKKSVLIKRKKLILILGLCVLLGMIVYQFSPIAYTARLNDAIQSNDVEKVKTLLKQNGDINRYNRIPILEDVGNTPLQEACIQGNIEVITSMLDAGAEVNTAEWSPLTLSLTNEYSNKHEVVEVLIAHGAFVKERDTSPILMLLVAKYDSSIGGMGMFGKKDNFNKREMYDIFMLLVENGASVANSSEPTGYSLTLPDLILYGTAIQGNEYILEYLINKENFDINKKLFDGKTVLMVAIENENSEMIKFLIEHEADTTLKNDEGKTALDIAKENNYQEIVELLE